MKEIKGVRKEGWKEGRKEGRSKERLKERRRKKYGRMDKKSA